MRYGIPLFSGRVAPRCTIADTILLVWTRDNKITGMRQITPESTSWPALLKVLIENRVDTLVCGGINKNDKRSVASNGISIIDNVACNRDEVCKAIENRTLRQGYGFSDPITVPDPDPMAAGFTNIPDDFNCLRCPGHECESGLKCPYSPDFDVPKADEKHYKMLDSSLDISMEEERNLCRLSELIYYALEMKYRKLGIAYCTDLTEPTEILVSVLRRFFDVIPVCCKIKGRIVNENGANGKKQISCNPIAQAELLNKSNTDFNIAVGLCIGADSIFAKYSQAPVTTLFVKDKSLANNPIGALYSEYYLKEAEVHLRD